MTSVDAGNEDNVCSTLYVRRQTGPCFPIRVPLLLDKPHKLLFPHSLVGLQERKCGKYTKDSEITRLCRAEANHREK
jgi:hypothetical protein